MLLNVFRNQRPASSLLVVLLFLVFWIPSWFLRPTVISTEGGMPLFWLIESICGDLPWAMKVLAALSVLGSSIIFNSAINSQDFFKSRNNLTLFFVVFLSFCMPESSIASPAHFSILFLSLPLGQLFKLYFDDGSLVLTFNASLYLAIGILFYAPMIAFLPLLPITLLINGRADWRHLTVVLFGIIAPILIVSSVWVWLPNQSYLAYETFWAAASKETLDILIPVTRVPIMISVLIVMVVSGVELSLNLGKKRVSNRKNFLLMIWVSIFGVVGFAFAPANQLTHLIVLAIPVGLLLSNFFYYIRNPKIGNIAILVILISALISVFTP